MAGDQGDDGNNDGNKGKREKPIKGFSLPASLRQMFEGTGSGPGQAPPPPKDWPEIDPASSELPGDCPVTALGVQSRTYFYLNAIGHLVELLDREHGPQQVLALFGGGAAYLEKVWPKYGAPNPQGMLQIIGWRLDVVVQCLMLECNRQGSWNPLRRMRGPGAWSDEQGRLIMHYGDEVQIDGEAHPPGLIQGFVYEAGQKWPHPSAELAPGGSMGPGVLILRLLQRWNWRQCDRDPWLELGHIAAGKIGGALGWRPAVWIVGVPGSGKTTLEERLLEPLYGRDGVLRLIDPSAAGIRQVNRHSSLPTIVDELEAGVGHHKQQQVVMLARYAASGGHTARGTAGHVPHEFTLRCCYTFSSVYAAPLNSQDRSRITILELQPLANTAELPDLEAKRIGDLGRLLTRRLVDQWPRFPGVFECFRQTLRKAGHNARSCDQHGTLAACLFLALHDHEPRQTEVPEDLGELNPEQQKKRADIIAALRPDDLAYWRYCFPATTLVEENDDVPDHQRCLDYLLASLVDPRRAGERRTIGQVIAELVGVATGSGEIASEVLDTIGLKLVMRDVKLVAGDGDEDDENEARLAGNHKLEPRLLVANTHRGLLDLFANSPWAGTAGSGGAGWVQALRRIPGAEWGDAVRFGGIKIRVTNLSLKDAFGLRDSSRPLV